MAAKLKQYGSFIPKNISLIFVTIFMVVFLECKTNVLPGVHEELSFLSKRTGIQNEEQLLSFLSPKELEKLAWAEEAKSEQPKIDETNVVSKLQKDKGPSIKDKAQYQKDRQARIETMHQQRIQNHLLNEEKKLRNQYEKLSSDNLTYKFDTEELTLATVDHKTGKFITYLEIPEDVTNSLKTVKKKFAEMYEKIRIYEKNSLDKIFKDFMQKSYLESVEKLKKRQKNINKQKQLEFLRISNIRQKEIIDNKKQVEAVSILKARKEKIEIERKKEEAQRLMVQKKKQFKRIVQEKFLAGFYKFVKDSQNTVGVTDTDSVLKSDEFKVKSHIWMAKYKLKLKEDAENETKIEQGAIENAKDAEKIVANDNKTTVKKEKSPEFSKKTQESESEILQKKNEESQKAIKKLYEQLSNRDKTAFTNIYKDQKVISTKSLGKTLEFTGNGTCTLKSDPQNALFDIILDDAENLAVRMYTSFTCSEDVPSQKSILKIFYDRTVQLLLDDVDQTQIANGMIGAVNFNEHQNEIKLMLIHDEKFQKKMIFYIHFDNSVFDQNISDRFFYSEIGEAIIGVVPVTQDIFFAKKTNGNVYGVLVKLERDSNRIITGGSIFDENKLEKLQFYHNNGLSKIKKVAPKKDVKIDVKSYQKPNDQIKEEVPEIKEEVLEIKEEVPEIKEEVPEIKEEVPEKRSLKSLKIEETDELLDFIEENK